MTVNTIAKAALPVVALLVAGGCKLSDPAPFDPRSLEEIQRAAADQVPARPMRPLPTTFQSPITNEMRPRESPNRPIRSAETRPVGPTLPMSLQDIVHRAVANNASARVAAYQAGIDEHRILEAEARFDPTFFANAAVQNQVRTLRQPTRPPGIPDPVTGQTRDFAEILSQVFAAGIRQTTTSGGQIELRAQLTRTQVINQDPTDTPEDPTDPYYDEELVLQITQPLLRDFGDDVNRARITIARNDFRISALDWRNELERALADVEQAYWQLWLARENVRIGEDFLRNTEATETILIKRLGQDTSRVQVSNARSQVEAANADLVRRRQRVEDLSDELKRLMNDPEMPVTSPEVILPADAPLDDPIQFQLTDQIETALRNRYDLMQQKLRIDNATTVVDAAQDNLQPQLNLTGQIGILGTGQDFVDSLDRFANTDLLNWAIGLEYEMPMGNRSARAIYHRTLLQRLQAMEEYHGLMAEVDRDVKVAYREVQTSWEEMIATKNQVFAAEDALSALRSRERAGDPLSAEFVNRILQSEQELAFARRAQAQAIASYNIALGALERAKGTLLRYNNVTLREDTTPVRGGGERMKFDRPNWSRNWMFWRDDK